MTPREIVETIHKHEKWVNNRAHGVCAKFQLLDLAGFAFTGCNLRGALFSGAALNGADFSYADMFGAITISCDLRGANLSGANLRGAKLSGANLTRAILRKTDMREGTMMRSDSSDGLVVVESRKVVTAETTVTFEDADLSGARLAGKSLVDSNLRNAM